MAYTEEELYDMDDDQLAEAMAAERAEIESPDTEYEEEHTSEPEVVENNEPEPEVEQPEEESADPEEGHDSETPNEVEEPATEEVEDNSEPEEDEVTKPVEQAEPKIYKYKANGQEFEFTQDEVISQFGNVFGKSMDYTKKMQAIAPYRKMISAMEEENLSENDMNLMIDALKGNKEAIASIVKRADVDVLDLDLDSESNYTPNSYGRAESELKVQEVIDSIASDKEFPITQHVVAEEWDDASRDVFAQNPELIKELHVDVINGTYDKVSPMAMKMKVLDGGRKSDIDYYIEAGKQYHMNARAAELKQQEMQIMQEEQAKVEQVKAQQQQRVQTKQAAPKRKAAAMPTKNAGTNKVTDYLDDSDTAFDEWYAKLQESM